MTSIMIGDRGDCWWCTRAGTVTGWRIMNHDVTVIDFPVLCQVCLGLLGWGGLGEEDEALWAAQEVVKAELQRRFDERKLALKNT